MSNYEKMIIQILLKSGVKFEREKSFNDLAKGKYRYDFYLPACQILIEVDGQYHFYPIRGKQELLAAKERDRQKNRYAIINNYKLYRIPFWEIDSVTKYEDIIKDKYLVHSKFHNDLLKIPKK